MILCDSQGKKKRQHGTEAVKSHILAAKTVANIVKSSLVRSRWGGLGLEFVGWTWKRWLIERVLVFGVGTARARQDFNISRWRYHGYERWCYYFGSGVSFAYRLLSTDLRALLILDYRWKSKIT